VLADLVSQTTTGPIQASILLNTDGSLLSFKGTVPTRAKTIAAVVSNAWFAYDRHARPPPSSSASGSAAAGASAASLQSQPAMQPYGIHNSNTQLDAGSDMDGLRELIIECEEGMLTIQGIGRHVLLCCVSRPDAPLGMIKAKVSSGVTGHLDVVQTDWLTGLTDWLADWLRRWLRWLLS
ncbi:hypothetical protein BC831DRAFT_463589, partial [Entophlyctis helioformis]